MNYSSHYIKNGTRGQTPYTGNFYSSPFLKDGVPNERPKANSLFAKLRQGDWPMNYRLIYSDYRNCSFFRVHDNKIENDLLLLEA
ncbi:hypothetical protein V5799_006748 [Amblyomma americanum]|uniref:Uncharacterized protein n=1 Tax=Amblyomma americanum TaxID=6943 RepID=A0AAQ4DVI2_AMBAM